MIKIGILGYGNLGRGVEKAVSACDDMELVGVFSRRDPSTVVTASGAKTYHVDALETMKDLEGQLTQRSYKGFSGK